jgi:hypothetical protein
MLHHFPQYGNSLLITHLGVDPNSLEGSEWMTIGKAGKFSMRAHVVLVAEDFYGLRLRVEKTRFARLEDSELIASLMEDFPSLAVASDDHYIRTSEHQGWRTRKYLVFNDDTDAVHFKLKWC